MLEGLDRVPWGQLEHAYGTAEDVPGLLRQLADPDPEVRQRVMHELYGNLFHQGTRYPATPYAVPFLIELCGDPGVPDRGELLRYWGDLIVDYFNVRERPVWGDGERIYWDREPMEDASNDPDGPDDPDYPYVEALHAIYRESLRGYGLLETLLEAGEPSVRAGATWVLACLPTEAERSVPLLESRLPGETEAAVRGALVFALGELGAEAPLRCLAEGDASPAVRCMATCELARLVPGEDLIC